MRARGLSSYEEYVRLLDTSPGEYSALTSALQATLRRGAWRGLAHVSRSRQLRRWVESLPVPALIAEGIPATHRLRLLACNRPACELLGQAEAALRATSSHLQWLHHDLTPCQDEDMPIYQAIWQGSATHGKGLLIRDTSGRLRALIVDAQRLRGGRPLAIEILHVARPGDGGPAPEAPLASLREARVLFGRYERLFEEAAVALIVTNATATVVEANGRAFRLLGAGEAQVVGQPLASYLTDSTLRPFHEALLSLAHSGQARAQLSLQNQPGIVFETEARQTRSGESSFVQWALHDVTAHVTTDRLRRDLVDLVLHDLRSPLATSILGVDTAERSLERDDTSRAQRSLPMVSAALRRLGRLVDSLLDVSRLEAGQPLLRPGEVEPGQLLTAAAAEVRPALEPRGLHLELEVAPDLPRMAADGDMLFRAVINLLDNAIKFSPPNGQVRLKATAQDYGLLICVSDQGPGVPLALQPRIFDKFVGLHLPQAPRGYGLGLAFCKLAAEAHGGWIAVDSTPGQGSTFALWLPARPEFPEVI